MTLAATEKIYETERRIGVEIVHDISHSVVHPVENHSRYDAARSVVKPAQEQANKEGVGHLRWVPVDE